MRWGGPSADTYIGGQTVVCKIALHKKNAKLRNETLHLHKINVRLHIFFVTRPPLARPPLVSGEGAVDQLLAELSGRLETRQDLLSVRVRGEQKALSDNDWVKQGRLVQWSVDDDDPFGLKRTVFRDFWS